VDESSTKQRGATATRGKFKRQTSREALRRSDEEPRSYKES
jgi:hypothetical protein